MNENSMTAVNDFGMTWHDTAVHVEALHRLLVKAGGQDELVALFAAVQDWPDEDDPDPSQMIGALTRFYDLPEREQRRILNGWKPDPERRSVAAVVEDHYPYAARGLLIAASPRDAVARSASPPTTPR